MTIPRHEFWEAIRVISGETYVYRNGFKEEADKDDVFILTTCSDSSGQVLYKLSCFNFDPLSPASDSAVRMNRANIAFAWYVDPSSWVIAKARELLPDMEVSADEK